MMFRRMDASSSMMRIFFFMAGAIMSGRRKVPIRLKPDTRFLQSINRTPSNQLRNP